MNNEQYLIFSYFVMGAACLALVLLSYVILRRRFDAFTAVVPGGRLGYIFSKLFLVGLVLPAVAGWLSVSYFSCNRKDYPAIVMDRAYLAAKSQEQLAASMFWVSMALLVWAMILTLGFLRAGRRRASRV